MATDWDDNRPPPGVRAKVCSGVLDDDTCDECESWDGVELAPDDDRLRLPNPRCTSPEGCRCVWIWTDESEAPSNIGPSREPPR